MLGICDILHVFYLIDPADNTTVIKSLYVDNGGNTPLAEFATSSTQDSGRTYVVGTEDITSFEFDNVYVTGASKYLSI